MRRKSVFLEILVRRFSLAGRHHVSSLPDYPSLPPALGWSPSSTLRSKRLRRRSGIFNKLARTAALLLVVSSPAFGAVSEVRSIGLTVDNLNRELLFYTNTLPFQLISLRDAAGPEEDILLGLRNVNLRIATLKLGDESLTLTEHVSNKGRQIPSDSRSLDHWFQHIAIVVSDMDRAYTQLRSHNVRHVSTAPQTLPDWNKNAGGIKAFYFRDPEDHVLEIIWFPNGKGDPKWQANRERLFLGIDHTAIVVSDTESSLAFYRDTLDMHVAGQSENYGVEQEHLNQVFGARLRITALRGARGPGVEFLEYITPPGGRPLPQDSKANDLLFWRTTIATDQLSELVVTLRSNALKTVSKEIVTLHADLREPTRAFIARDPDGHAVELLEPFATTSVSARR